MLPLPYVTTNRDKFAKAVANLEQFGITLVHEPHELSELQSFSGEEIVRDKAQQAYERTGGPVLVNDDTWSIPALRGFPSTSMKVCNHFLQAEDWLRLMSGVTDRRIFLNSHYAFHNGKTIQTFMGQDEMYFLDQARGVHVQAPCLEVVAWAGSENSVAEDIAAGAWAERQNIGFWKEFAEILRSEKV